MSLDFIKQKYRLPPQAAPLDHSLQATAWLLGDSTVRDPSALSPEASQETRPLDATERATTNFVFYHEI